MLSARIFAIVFLLAASLPARAHEMSFLRVSIEDTASGDYLLSVDFPAALQSIAEYTPRWPEGCGVNETGRRRAGAVNRTQYEISCAGEPDELIAVSFPWSESGVFLTRRSLDGADVTFFLSVEDGRAVYVIDKNPLAGLSWGKTAIRYLSLGVEHILAGWDHLAFVLCLCFIAGGWRLPLLITAFTLGHSLSLALSFLGLVTIPIPPIEASIALSIAFVARAAWKTGALDERQQMPLVAGFGLLHGLGFASALNEIGVSATQRFTGLLFFNLGVEAGQLIFVAIALAAFAIARMVGAFDGARRAALVAAGSLGMFWTIERIAGFAWS